MPMMGQVNHLAHSSHLCKQAERFFSAEIVKAFQNVVCDEGQGRAVLCKLLEPGKVLHTLGKHETANADPEAIFCQD